MKEPEKRADLLKKDVLLCSALKKKDIKPIQILLVEELEDIERKLRENLAADDKESL